MSGDPAIDRATEALVGPDLYVVPDLEDELGGEEPEWDAPPEVPHDRERANQLLYRLRKVEEELAKQRATVANEQLRLDRHANAIEEAAAKKRGHLSDQLAMFHRAELATGGPKTLKLPNGTLKAVKQQDAWHWPADTTGLVAWLRSNWPKLVRKYEPKPPDPDAPQKDEIKALLKQGIFSVGPSGQLMYRDEVIPDVAVEKVDPKFTVEVTS